SDSSEFLGAPDSLITRDQAFLHISNFTELPTVIEKGRLLGYAHLPDEWLDRPDKMDDDTRQTLEARAAAVKSYVDDRFKSDEDAARDADFPGEDELEGGPKTAEAPDPDPIPSSQLLSEVHFSPDLSPEQRTKLEAVVSKHPDAFSLDGRLGHYDSQVKVPLQPDSKPVSQPPFPSSPEKRGII
ncbi:hypothetical protein SCHPADRAFT_813623, partial [Schizopora paradoxa]